METMLGSLDIAKPTSNDVVSCKQQNSTATIQPSTAIATSDATLGRHLARRLVQVGVTDVFSVPGDFNLTLLDHLINEPELNLIGCCNELNAGYAADGYARSRGVGACVVTFTVGGLSVLNAIAGAYSENLPLICIVGGPNSNDYGTSRILHHTIGVPDFSQELRCFQTVTCFQAVVNNLEDAHELIDTAISTALKESKPVYISIGCNLPGIPHPTFSRDPVPFSLAPKLSNHMGLEAAVEAAVEFLNKAVKPVLVGGPKLRVAKASDAFVELADASGYALAVMPSAKGMVPEHHPHFIGTYWGAVSTAFCAEIVESADAYLFAGPIFNDYSSVGYSLLLKKEKAIIVQPDRVVVANGPAFGCILMKDFLKALAKRLKHNNAAYENYHRIFVPDGKPLKSAPKEPLRVNVMFQHIQQMLSRETAVIAETGDSWFNCQKLKLPEGCGYEFQMQYGSIGWSVGATLGYAQAVPEKRVIACIGDGSFQVTAQDVSTMLRCGQKTIIFLINNGGYTIEVEIHDGPYNVIKNWNYTGLIDAIHNGEGKCWTTKVFCEEELVEAIATATGPKKDSLCFIEVIVHKDDTSKELLEWGSRVSAANSRPPIFKSFVLGRFTVFMTGREASKILLTGKDGLVSLNLFYTGQQVLGPTSLLQTTGEAHKRLRRLIAEPLSLDGLKKYFHFINTQAIVTLDQWEGKKVHVLEEASTFTLKVIGHMIMSLEPTGEDQEKFRSNFKIISSSFASLPFKLPGTAFHRGIKARDRMYDMLDSVISRRRNGQDFQQDFLESLIMKHSRKSDGQEEDENKLTDKQLKDNVLTLLVAGHDTTTAALTWLIKFLEENQNVLEQLREEHNEIIANRKSGTELTWSEVNNMPYTAKVISETLRRATILPWYSRKAAQDFEIDGYQIKKGWSVNLDVVSIHHDPKVFPDPEKFNPSRFDEHLRPFSFLGFGSGPRMCPGMNLAKVEICVFIHHLVTRYKWRALEKDDSVQPTLVRMPKNKYPVIVESL